MRFDADFLNALEHLRLVSKRTAGGGGRGERRAQQRGRGIEFADYRPYAQGDDFRHIDWKAYKRLGRLLLRLFDEEQDLSVYVFLDTSRSMAAHGKFAQAVRVAAALSYVGIAHLDRVAILPFSDRLGRMTSAGGERHTIGRMLAALDGLSPDGVTNLWNAIREFAERSSRPGLAIVISDFLDSAGAERALRLLASRGHEVVAIHMAAALDREPGLTGLDEVTLVDAETGDERTIEVTSGFLRAYAEAWSAFDTSLESACRACHVQYVRVDPDVPVERTVLDILRRGRVLA
jgi:uncharacterized protein (DUF58 family)